MGKTADHLAINATTRHQRAKGLSKAGSLRDTTLNTLGLAVDAINAGTLKVKTARSTKIIVAVECVKNGQKACTADKDGNIGTGNRGKDNYGGKNTGNNNIGKEAGWGGRQAVWTMHASSFIIWMPPHCSLRPVGINVLFTHRCS